MAGTDEDAALIAWLESVQSSRLSLDRIVNPSRGGRNVGALLDDAGAGLTLDREPARFYKLLVELAPEAAKRG